ncbi:amino acid adenylation domain-containing protein [Dactylosporangium sp. NBC_01737]|uniref:non-ribosomal peptide synthetase/MFS transporter n=1 Tax=Dactylosporangium sp. NBC_01737 TaxID=2975959 RepID=UPI002E0F752C|nr:non-ribosomal peptide synthetase [Dactylosporangium sp. NBC_01737]WSG36577.1 amino acid adenylation domain-containing protein [Dactylosporangium sp. NBC_01737]
MSTDVDLSAARAELLRRRLQPRRAEVAATAVPRRGDDAHPPLSYAQERLWFMDQLVPGTAAYTVPIAVRLRGPLDEDRLRAALDAVAARHETLRTRFLTDADGRPEAVVDERVSVPLETFTETEEAAVRARVAETGARPFDLTTGLLIRAALIRVAEREHVLAVVLHHIASDGWSIDVFLKDLLHAYAGRPLAPLQVRYGDYAAWQRADYAGQRLEGDLDYWHGQLAGVPALDLPTDRPRPAEQRFHGAGHVLQYGEDLADAVAGLGRRFGATPYMILLAAYETLLYRYCGQDDFAVGSTVAGRTLPELEGVVGLFANVLAVRADLSGDPTFADLVGRVRERVLDAFDHQETPFDRLVTRLRMPRDVSRSPVFQATFTMLNYGRGGLPDAGLSVEPFPIEARQTRFDLELYLFDPAAAGGLSGFITYNTDLFEPGTVQRLAGHLERILHAVTADPDQPIGRIPMLAAHERAHVLHDVNASTVDIGPAGTLHGLIEEQARRTPDAPAVVFEGRSMSYGELDARATGLAARLRADGAGPGRIVAVHAERGPELVVALLAALKSGAAYLPLDPDNPPDRTAFMIEDAAPIAVLSTVDLTGPVPAAPRLEPLGTPDDVAYVIYTSGSTGRPKGVPNTHRAIHNRLDWMQRTYSLDAGDAVLQKTPIGFDVSVWELFWPLMTGARLVLARPGGHRDAAYLRDLIIAERVTTVHFVPSMLAVFLAEDGIEACTSLRRVVASGEALPVDLARTALDRLGCGMYNLYGPTEAAVDVSWWECTPAALAGRARVPIGRPIQNIRLYVLDPAGEPVPVGVPGELHIAGVGVAAGYLNRPELTAERFRDDPFGPPGDRMYATGDLARRNPDGTLDYLGRLDDQVKLRGMRIEPGEIAAVLRARPGVRDAAVVVREDRPGDQRLVAYVVGDGFGDLRAALKQVLPDAMVPAAYVTLPALPVTANGKLDRRALPAPAIQAATTEFAAPATATETAIAAVWAAVLDLPRVGADDDFFDLGGHSLLATQVVAKLRAVLPSPVSVMDVFKHPTVRRLGALVDTPVGERGPRRLLHELTKPIPDGQRVMTLVCLPYGGGSAIVYQPLADALPAGHALFALAIPGNDVGLEEQGATFDALVADTTAEILERIDGPVTVYGHCGVGGALAVAVACAVEAAGREVQTLFIGAIFPFARPRGRFAKLLSRFERLRSDRAYTNWLTSVGLDLSDVAEDQLRAMVRGMRRDSEAAEEFFTSLYRSGTTRLRAPIVSIVGERDDETMYYQERFREWHFLTGTTALYVLDEAGHYFLKWRAEELAAILTAQRSFAGERTEHATDSWRLAGVSDSGRQQAEGPAPSMPRFLGVAASQLVSMTGSAMTEFAVPVWIFLHTHSLFKLALFSTIALVPGMLVLPFAGALVDRHSRRAVMLASDGAALLIQGVFLALLLTDTLQIWHIYVLLAGLSIALTFQRLAYFSAVPQLVPKRYLGHANGMVQTGAGIAQFLVPVAAVGVMAAIGLDGILALDVASYAIAVIVLALVKFPALMGYRRREPMGDEIRSGFRYAMGTPGFRAMLLFFAVSNLFLGPVIILVQPLVLSFADLRAVTHVAVAGGAGVVAGGLLMAVWGGPARRKMRGVLCSALTFAAFAALAGLYHSVALTAVGVFGMYAALTTMNAIYTTIIQVKVPPRAHGRVFAVNTVFAFGTLPIAFIVIGPAVSAAIGLGPTYLLFGAAIAVIALAAMRYRPLARFDVDVPDTEPEDLIGLTEIRRRASRQEP